MERMLSERQAAKFLGLKRQTLSNWRHLRKGPAYIKISRRVLYLKDDLREYLDQHRVTPEESKL
jgi:predicted DNA-binding transcriptional regulator AlpA